VKILYIDVFLKAKMTAHALGHVTCRQGVKHDHIFGITMAILPIHYIRAKNFNSLQSYVRAIWVKTRKQQKWFWGDIITCCIPDWPLQD